MYVDAWDSVFIRARRVDVHPVLADLVHYGTWWPGVTCAATGDAGVQVFLRAPGVLRRSHRVQATVTRVRGDLGVDLGYQGDLSGEAEFYYLDEPGGTVVTYLLRATTARRAWRTLLRDHRAAVRAGLHELKDRLECGREAGAELAPALRQHQAEAKRAFDAEVAAWALRQAAGAAAAAAVVGNAEVKGP